MLFGMAVGVCASVGKVSLHNNSVDVDVVSERTKCPGDGLVRATAKYVNFRGAVSGVDSVDVHVCVPEIDLILVPGGTTVPNCMSEVIMVYVTSDC